MNQILLHWPAKDAAVVIRGFPPGAPALLCEAIVEILWLCCHIYTMLRVASVASTESPTYCDIIPVFITWFSLAKWDSVVHP